MEPLNSNSSVPCDTRFVLFRYRNRKGTEIVIGTSLAWLVAVIVLALIRPEVFALPAAITGFWKSWRGGGSFPLRALKSACSPSAGFQPAGFAGRGHTCLVIHEEKEVE